MLRDNPVEILNFLQENKDDYYLNLRGSSSICQYDLIKWHEFGKKDLYSGKPQSVKLWKKENGHIVCDWGHIELFSNIGQPAMHIETYTCDIQDVIGLSASKSNLSSYDCMHKMAQKGSPEMVDEISLEKLKLNLRWPEIRIINQTNTSDNFVYHAWDKRLFLSNSGGSHHFASARYIANQLKIDVPLEGKLIIHSIAKEPLSELVQHYAMFAVTLELGKEYSLVKHLVNFNVASAIIELPRGAKLNSACILFPRKGIREQKVLEIFEELGFFDLGTHLLNLATEQYFLKE